MVVATDHDIQMMAEALALARRAAGRTSPNPLVGAVVVAGGQVVGRGFHARAGTPHAEIEALRDAGTRARGATLYVTLEPCAHAGRTGPCTDSIIAAGIRRVVAAMIDPDAQVNGKGVARLRDAGVDVAVGVLEREALRLNEGFVKHRRTGLPLVTLKWAMSLDGKIASAPGRTTAITGDEAGRFVHELRNVADAILVGVGTVLADDPRLTCRLPGGRHPTRIIVDSCLRTPLGAHVVTGASEAPTILVTTDAAAPDRARLLRAAGIEVLVLPAREGRVDLRQLLVELGRRGMLSVLVEGGGTLNAALWSLDLVDKVVALIAPRVLGGADAPTPVDGAGPVRGPDGVRLRDLRVWPIGNDWACEGYVDA